MKTLIAYYSKTGNTERVAKELASLLGSETEKIIDKKNRKGILGFISGGRDAAKKISTEIEPSIKNPGQYDLVIVGTPIWASSMVPAIRAYLSQNKGAFKKWSFFVTSGSTEAEQIRGDMEETAGLKAASCFGLNAKELPDKDIFKKKIDAFVDSLKE